MIDPVLVAPMSESSQRQKALPALFQVKLLKATPNPRKEIKTSGKRRPKTPILTKQRNSHVLPGASPKQSGLFGISHASG
jgi:hypothetical protein